MRTRKTKPPRETMTERLGGKVNVIAMFVFFIISMTVGMILIDSEARKAEESQYLDSWEITQNRNIEWTWAGKEARK